MDFEIHRDLSRAFNWLSRAFWLPLWFNSLMNNIKKRSYKLNQIIKNKSYKHVPFQYPWKCYYQTQGAMEIKTIKEKKNVLPWCCIKLIWAPNISETCILSVWRTWDSNNDSYAKRKFKWNCLLTTLLLSPVNNQNQEHTHQ